MTNTLACESLDLHDPHYHDRNGYEYQCRGLRADLDTEEPAPAPVTLGLPVDLLADGMLWAINRTLLHPRGFALQVDTTNGGLHLIGDGREVFGFTEQVDDEKFPIFEALLERARRA